MIKMKNTPLSIFLGAALLLPCAFSWANTAIEPVSREGIYHDRYLERARQGGIDVLFLGDSITQYWEDPARGKPVWDREFAPLNAANFGINGDRTQHVLWRLQNGEAEGYSPKVVVLLIGTNNTRRNTTPEAVEGISAVVKELRGRFSNAKILLLGLLPRGDENDPRKKQVVEINEKLAKMDDGQTVFFLDIGDRFLDSEGNVSAELMPDLLHPNLKGYEVMAEALRGPLRNLLSQP